MVGCVWFRVLDLKPRLGSHIKGVAKHQSLWHQNRILGPSNPQQVTGTWNILNHTPIGSTSYPASIQVYDRHCSQTMSGNSFPQKTMNLTPPDGKYGLWQCSDEISGPLINRLLTTTGRVSWSGKHVNEYHPQHGYGYCPCQQPCPGVPLIYHHSPLILTDTVHNQPPVYANNIQVMGHSVKDRIYTKVVIVSLKWFPSTMSLVEVGHPEVHWECLDDHRETIQFISKHFSALLIHLYC
jgi:hypothetical protein